MAIILMIDFLTAPMEAKRFSLKQFYTRLSSIGKMIPDRILECKEKGF